MRKTGSVMLLDCNDASARAANVATCDQAHAEFFPTLASSVQSLAQLRRLTTLTHCRSTGESVADAKEAPALDRGCTRCGIERRRREPAFWIAVVEIEFNARQATAVRKPIGGEGGIRTPDTVARMPHFECGAFNHSATSPEPRRATKSPIGRRYLTKWACTD